MNIPNKKPDTVFQLLQNIEAILAQMEKEITELLEKYGIGADLRQEQQDQIEIQHVGYDADQLGREK